MKLIWKPSKHYARTFKICARIGQKNRKISSNVFNANGEIYFFGLFTLLLWNLINIRTNYDVLKYWFFAMIAKKNDQCWQSQPQQKINHFESSIIFMWIYIPYKMYVCVFTSASSIAYSYVVCTLYGGVRAT